MTVPNVTAGKAEVLVCEGSSLLSREKQKRAESRLRLRPSFLLLGPSGHSCHKPSSKKKSFMLKGAEA